MRQRYIQCKKTLELIPIEEYVKPGPNAPMIMKDISPYKSMITGETIMGRRQHREHLRQHGCIEVGNEKLTPKPRTLPSREDRRRDIHQVMTDLGL